MSEDFEQVFVQKIRQIMLEALMEMEAGPALAAQARQKMLVPTSSRKEKIPGRVLHEKMRFLTMSVVSAMFIIGLCSAASAVTFLPEMTQTYSSIYPALPTPDEGRARREDVVPADPEVAQLQRIIARNPELLQILLQIDRGGAPQ